MLCLSLALVATIASFPPPTQASPSHPLSRDDEVRRLEPRAALDKTNSKGS
jgi:hypothetical protein